MSGPGGKFFRPWSALLALVFAVSAAWFSGCTTTTTSKSPTATQATKPGPPPMPTARPPSRHSSLPTGSLAPVDATQKLLNQLSIKWKEPGPPVVVFHSPG